MENAAAAPAPRKKFKFTLPNTMVLMVIIIVFACLLTWIIPASTYDYVEDASGVKVVDPDSFRYIERTPVNPLRLPQYIVKGFAENIDLGVLILFAGGAFGMVVGTGAIQSMMARVVKRLADKALLFVPILLVLFAFIFTSQTLKNFIVFVPVICMICLALGLDSLTAVAILVCASNAGYSTGSLQVISTAVAQRIAGLPVFSGMGYRFVCFFAILIPTGIMLMAYVRRIHKDPTKSFTYEMDKNHPLRDSADLDSFGPLTTRKVLILLVTLAGIVVMALGALIFKFGYQEFSVTFLLLGVLVGIIAGYGPSDIAVHFEKGCITMVNAWFITAFAMPIANVLADGQIINTIVHTMCSVLFYVPYYLQGAIMFLANAVINVFLTSGSGQAAAVMPIMIPVADAMNITRQTAVLAFNFGDGFTNWILPSNSVLMSALAAAAVPFDKWIKFIWKILVMWVAVGIIMMVIAQMINYGPF